MIPLAEMSRLAGRIFPCVHMGFFIPLAETKFYYYSACETCTVHFSHATQLFKDFGVFLYLFARKSIALARYLTLSYSTNIKLSKKC